MSLSPGLRLAVPAGCTRGTRRAEVEGATEAAALGGGDARDEGAAPLSPVFTLGALEGDSALAIPRKRPTISVLGGGGGGG